MATILKGGKIYDGSGREAFLGDVLFDGDRIIRIGADIRPSESDDVIDISGLSVAPGFFDAHSHNDWFAIKKEPAKYFEPFIRQGITSFITGNCGLSATGFKPDTKFLHTIGGGLFGDDTTGVYPTVTEFLDAIDGNNPCNIAVLVGHCTSRGGVAGNENRELTDEEMKEMLGAMEQGLKEGACGLSLGLMYLPGKYAHKSELREMAKLCEKYDRPLTVHARALSKVSLDYPLLGRPHILRAMDELVEVCKGLKMKFQYSHAIFVGKKTFACKDELHSIINRMRDEGIDAQFDIYNELLGVSVITVVMPAWFQALTSKQKHSWWNKLKLSVMCKFTIMLLGFDWNNIQIAYLGEGNEKWEGKSIAQCAREMGKNVVDGYLELCEMSGYNGRVNMGPYSTPQIISWQSRQDNCLYMTDAWVEDHGIQNPAIYDCFPKFLRCSLLGEGDTMPRTIRKMSGAVADRFSIKERGYLKEGCYADICVFDENELKAATPDREKSFGIRKVWINGNLVLEDDKINYNLLKTSGRAMKSINYGRTDSQRT